MNCPVCDSDLVTTLSSQASGTVTVRRRQCRACEAKWLVRVVEEVMAGTVQKPLALPRSNQPAPGLSKSGQTLASPQDPSLDLILRSDPDPSSESGSGDRGCDEPPLLTFPVTGGRPGAPREWNFRKGNFASLTEAFPALDVMAEARKALAWVNSNPRQKKTADGMPRFLFNWMGRAQNNGGAKLPVRDIHQPPRLA